MEKTVFIECSVNLEIDETKLTKELMDSYERYITDINEDPDFDKFETQLEKHIANISWYILRGEDDFIEGYGKVSTFIKKQTVHFGAFEEMTDE